jgi:2-polyprenyl-6-methoxyphenol hydroxylase-like FAD-dependent oxidoreductase
MRVAVVGAGPAGLVGAIALARAGHEVVVVDRDAGPPGGEPWRRKGVMQFHHPHVFRAMTRNLLRQRLPDVLAAVLAAGVEAHRPDGEPVAATILRARRETFERALWRVAGAEPNLALRQGHADRVLRDGHRVTGVTVDGTTVRADLVVDATGRSGRLAADLRPPAEGGDSGVANASRVYRLRPGTPPGPHNNPLGFVAAYDRYTLIVFVHDGGTFSPLILRAREDRALAALRHTGAFEAAMAAHPATAAWTARAEPVTPVRVGLHLFNRYRRQPARLTGLLSVGDSVCATSPTGGRGVSLAIASALAMADIVTGSARDAWAPRLDAWCLAHIHPWYRDSVVNDETTVRRWQGQPADLSGPLPPDLVTLTAEADPAIRPDVVHYTAMLATSACLEPVEDRARRVLSGGWRPAPPDGPDRAQLLAAIGTWS